MREEYKSTEKGVEKIGPRYGHVEALADSLAKERSAVQPDQMRKLCRDASSSIYDLRQSLTRQWLTKSSTPSPTPSGPSPISILNRLPTKRIDAAITAAAESGIPGQGEQIGGYTPNYAHFSHLPLLPLYSQAQNDLLVKQQALKDRRVEQVDANDPDKLLSGSQKATLSVMGHLSGGANIVGVKRWERRLKGASVVTANRMMEQYKLIVFTRWTMTPMQGTPWFVDVLEHRFLDQSSKMGGNVVMLKAGLASSSAKKDSKITLKFLKTDVKGLKNQKLWTKRWNLDPCEMVTFIGDDGKEVPMEIVVRLQRTCSSLEAQEVQKRFSKQWVVPVLQ